MQSLNYRSDSERMLIRGSLYTIPKAAVARSMECRFFGQYPRLIQMIKQHQEILLHCGIMYIMPFFSTMFLKLASTQASKASAYRATIKFILPGCLYPITAVCRHQQQSCDN